MRKADRGEDAVSVVIGAVLMLGLLMTLLAVLQTTAVPIWNEDTEFSHSQNVQEDIQSLGSAISFVSSSGTPRSVTVDMGTEYTDRVVLQNPPDASGTLRSIDGYLNISNAQVETSRETQDYWDGGEKPFETRIITYTPDYNRYQDAPSTVYGNSMVYNYWSGIDDSRYNANLTLSEQSMINGRNINLVVLNGSISTGQVESKTVSLRPNSVMETTIAPTDDDDPITITVTSPLTAANWTSALQDEIDNGNVVDVSDTGADYNGLNKLEITLDSDKTYNLRMAEVGIQQGREVPEYYLTDIEGNDTTVLTDSSQKLVAEVRDKYNNPVSGVTVNGSADDGSLANSQRVSTSDGTVTFDYTAPSNSGTDYVNISMDSDPETSGSNFQPRQKENVTFYLDVTSGGGGGGGGGDGNGNSACLSYNNDAVAEDGGDELDNNDRQGGVEFTVSNSNSCDPVEIRNLTINPDNPNIDNLDENYNDGTMFVSVDPPESEISIDTDNNNFGYLESGDYYVDYNGRVNNIGDGLELTENVIDLDDPSGDILDSSNNNPVIDSGDTARFYLYEFWRIQGEGKGQGSHQNKNMSGESVDISLGLSDGSVKQFTANPE
ncbi:Ig-like domain-containing protein (plasmid) [Halorutilales archaeon Cl-col2-1]